MTIFLIIGLLIGGGVVLYGALTVKQVDDSLSARLNRFELKPARNLTELELQIPRSERILGPPRRKIARLVRLVTPAGAIEKAQIKLLQAGSPRDLSVQDLLGIKGLCTIAMAAVGFLFSNFLLHLSFMFLILAVAGGGFVGFNLPDFWLRNLVKKRQKAIQKFLPDAIDILAISVEAGQGFDGALETLARRKQNELTREFDRFRYEVSAGKGRREAFRDLAMRAAVDDLNAFVAAMVQADQLGIGIAQVLRSQAQELRIKRRQRAEEKAHQAPIKMLFPLILLMFPALFMVILGPAIPKMMTMMH